jgi:hypothetical protein
MYLNRPNPPKEYENSLFLMMKMALGMRHGSLLFALLFDAMRRGGICTLSRHV